MAKSTRGNAFAPLTCLEICAGAGGQSLGLETAGFHHLAAVEIDPDACQTLRANRPGWRVVQSDVRMYDGAEHRGVDLVAGGVPCPPFSIAGQQLGARDERDLFGEVIRLAEAVRPKALMIENVRGLSTTKFAAYRGAIESALRKLGYVPLWRLLNAVDFGVPQYRARFLLVALERSLAPYFAWPSPRPSKPITVGEALVELMGADGWRGAARWAKGANDAAPTLVGGSKKHGGPDLGPTRARLAWAKLGVDGKGLADLAPTRTDPVDHMPRLTVPMAARIQAFPADWRFHGKKTAAYRQVGNAFPPPLAAAVGGAIRVALQREGDRQNHLIPGYLFEGAPT